MKLYFAPNSRAVRIAWLLEELGMDYEIEKYSVGDKALRTPEYYKLHPMGRVPVLEDESIKIYGLVQLWNTYYLNMIKENFVLTKQTQPFLIIYNGFIMLKAQLCHKLIQLL